MINKSAFSLKTKPKPIKSKYGYPIFAFILLALVVGYLSPKTLVAGQKVYYGVLLNFLNQESKFHENISSFFAKIETVEELEAKLHNIEPDYAKLQTLKNEFTSLAKENYQLRALLDIKQNKFSHAITAELIDKPNTTTALEKEIYISFPKEANVHVNQALASPQGLVGKITSIPSDGLARVLLIYDKSFHLGAQIKGTEIKGILRGTDNPYELVFTPLNKNIQLPNKLADIGSQIVTRDSSPIFPNHIDIGNIFYISSNSIIIKPNVDFKQLKWLFILDQHPNSAIQAELKNNHLTQ